MVASVIFRVLGLAVLVGIIAMAIVPVAAGHSKSVVPASQQTQDRPAGQGADRLRRAGG